MNVNLLAISIGNTTTHIGAFVQGQLELCDHCDNEDVDMLDERIKQVNEALRDTDDAPVLIGSVHTEAMAMKITRVAERLTERKSFRIEQDMPVPIGRQLDPETIVGEDRLLNAAAAYSVLKQTCVVVDAGTALTVDFVDGAGTFHGGAILPGANMMLAALHEHTVQLPEVQPVCPREAVGHSTGEAMLSGMFYGIRGAVRELTEQFAEKAGSYPLVVATGGNAEMLFADCPIVDRIVPQLTLMGMAVTMQQASDAEV